MTISVKVAAIAAAILCGGAFSGGMLFENIRIHVQQQAAAQDAQAQRDAAERRGLTQLFSGGKIDPKYTP